MIRRRRLLNRTLAWGVASTLLAACDHGGPVVPPTVVYPQRDSEAALIEILALTYERRDYDTFATLFHPDYQLRLNAPAEDGTEYWGLAEELRLHRCWFRHEGACPPDSTGAPGLQARRFPFQFTTRGEFGESIYFPPPGVPGPIDPARWAMTSADYSGRVTIETQGDTDYVVPFRWEFVVLRDRTAAPADPNRFLLYRWTDLGVAASSFRNEFPPGSNVAAQQAE